MHCLNGLYHAKPGSRLLPENFARLWKLACQSGHTFAGDAYLTALSGPTLMRFRRPARAHPIVGAIVCSIEVQVEKA